MAILGRNEEAIYDGIDRGVARATGDVIGLMHSDARFKAPDVLVRVTEALADNAADAVHGDLVHVSAADPARVIRYWKSGACHPDRSRRGWMPAQPALSLRREVFDRWGTYDRVPHCRRLRGDFALARERSASVGLHPQGDGAKPIRRR